MAKWVYIAQYGYLWRLPWDVWIACARSGAEGNGYLLPRRYRVKRARRFTKVRHEPESLSENEFRPRYGVIYLEPLDWDPDEFQDWLTNNAPSGSR